MSAGKKGLDTKGDRSVRVEVLKERGMSVGA